MNDFVPQRSVRLPVALHDERLGDEIPQTVGYIILGILAAAFCYVTFCNTIFDEYGSVAPQVASGILGFWAGTFALRLFFRGFRSYWTTVWFALIITLYVGAIVFNAISEYFFWNEFGVRYNFIAVDYLVYTNEVVGNIMESYPVLPMSLGIIVVTLLITWYLFRRDLGQADRLIGWRWKAVAGPAISQPCCWRFGCCISIPGFRTATTST